MTRSSSRIPTGGVLVSLASAAALLVGLRSVATFELPRPSLLLRLEGLPREGLGLSWTERARWPVELQEAALERMAALLAALVLSAVAVATLNALILLTESAAARRGELAVRGALGAPPGRLASMLVRELRTLLAGACALGLIAGLALGGLARALWPGWLADPALEAALADVAGALGLLTGGTVVTHLWTGLSATRGAALASALRTGRRTGSDPLAVFIRRALPVVHATVAGTVLVGALALSGEAPPLPGGEGVDGGTFVVSGTSPAAGSWAELRAALAGVAGLDAESLAAPGALLGLGVRDYATAQCGKCTRGLLPAPLWGVVADHHAVGPGYFELAGLEIVEGRGFRDGDGPGAEPVAVVNRTFANTAFERGRPIGKHVKLGKGLGSWYRVVGVVEDVRVATPGADETARSVVWVSALQQPFRAGSLLLRGSPEAVESAAAHMRAAGFAPGPPRALADVRADAGAALEWMRTMTVGLAAAALLLALHGVHRTALQVTRRRIPELAVRRALGAGPGRIVLHVLAERLVVAGWGVAGTLFFGTLFVAFLTRAAGTPAPGPLTYFGVALTLAWVALVAATGAVREALRIEPAAALD